MTKRAAPRLEAGLIARKGEATPSTPATVVAPARPADQNGTPLPPTPHGLRGTTAVTVRLDPERYERMKIFGVKRRMTNQDILVAALDRYLNDVAT